MRRREFFESGLMLAAASQAGRAQSTTPRRALMKLGTQHGDSDDILRVMAAFGVNHICSATPSAKGLDASWSVEALTALRERIEKFGIQLDMVQLPTNAYITNSGIKNVMLGKSPERDREIDGICQMIRNSARAGIPILKYNLTILAVVRTDPTPGRGGASYSTFDYAAAKQDPPLTEAGPVSADDHWERITHLLGHRVHHQRAIRTRQQCEHEPVFD